MNTQAVQIDVKPSNGKLIKRTFHIHGKKAKKLMGGTNEVTLVASSMKMAMSAMVYRYGPKFRKFISEGMFRVYHDNIEGDGVKMADVQNLEDARDVHIMPVVRGAGNSRAGQIIMGVVLIVVGIITVVGSWGSSAPGSYALIANGFMMILGGALTIYTALTTPQGINSREVAENKSFTFDNTVNVVEQGGAVPIVYGVFLSGSTVVCAGMDTEQLSTYNSPVGRSIAPDGLFGLQVNVI